jgi:hypothetical protein
LIKLSLQIGLHDRSSERRTIRQTMTRILHIRRPTPEKILGAIGRAKELREIANSRDPVERGKLGAVDELTERLFGKLSQDEIQDLDTSDLKRVMSVTVFFAQLAIRASLAADEAELTGGKTGQALSDSLDDEYDDDRD